MTVDNLAILITPCIFRPLTDDVFKELLETKQLVNTSKILFKYFEMLKDMEI